jgi:hypothetical protein
MTPTEAERLARIESHIARVAREMERGESVNDSWYSIQRPPPRSKAQYQAMIRRLNMMGRNPGWSIETPKVEHGSIYGAAAVARPLERK